MTKNNTWKFFILVFLLSIPFWVLGFFSQKFTQLTPIKLPLSALMAICPLLAALILTDKKSKNTLLLEVFDFRKIKNKLWIAPTILSMPIIAVISYFYLWQKKIIEVNYTYTGIELGIFFAVFFIGAIAEEVGWSGYAKRPMIKEFGALKTGLVIGIIWAVWHIIPYIEMNKTPAWILLQCINTVLLRIVMIWLFSNSNYSVFTMVLFHTMINISPYLLSKIQVTYDPIILLSSLLFIVIIILVVLEPKSLSSFRKRTSGPHV
ncbi:MAG: CPBP family intramembrane glutamic endopeptidase [Cyclobacteriaceae bacterium]